jgi:hypothetical protein
MGHKAAALRDFNPPYIWSRSNASDRHVRDARAMSAFTPIASKYWKRSETTRCANRVSMHRKVCDLQINGAVAQNWPRPNAKSRGRERDGPVSIGFCPTLGREAITSI